MKDFNKEKILAKITSSVVVLFFVLVSLASISPQISFGQSGGTPRNFYDLIMNTIIGGMLKPIIYLIVSSAVVVFLWGVFKFVRAEGDDKESGKQFMVWGIVGLFVMLSVWGLVNVLRNTFNLNDTTIRVPRANM